MYKFFSPSVCHTCKNIETDTAPLKTCGNCHMIFYCSVKHQKQHWPQHKKICRTIKYICDSRMHKHLYELMPHPLTQDAWKTARVRNVIDLELRLGRQLTRDEHQMIMFPKVCEVCKIFCFSKMIKCEECHSTYYCSEVHKSESLATHMTVCFQLKLCLDLDIEMYTGYVFPQYPVIAYKKDTSPEKPLANIKSFIRQNCDRSHTNSHIAQAVLSYCLTCPLTVMYALEQVNTKICEYLIINIVGAGNFELSTLRYWEVILHWFHKLTCLKINLIGPECEKQAAPKLCKVCLNAGKSLEIVCHKLLYHDFCKTSKYENPHVVAAFNCGIHEFDKSSNDPWEATIADLLRCKRTPLAITSYTQLEAEKDLERILEKSENTVECKVNCQINPFACIWPLRNFEETSSVFYNNNYLSIIVNP